MEIQCSKLPFYIKYFTVPKYPFNSTNPHRKVMFAKSINGLLKSNIPPSVKKKNELKIRYIPYSCWLNM